MSDPFESGFCLMMILIHFKQVNDAFDIFPGKEVIDLYFIST